jgi:hypothetical protein
MIKITIHVLVQPPLSFSRLHTCDKCNYHRRDSDSQPNPYCNLIRQREAFARPARARPTRLRIMTIIVTAVISRTVHDFAIRVAARIGSPARTCVGWIWRRLGG